MADLLDRPNRIVPSSSRFEDGSDTLYNVAMKMLLSNVDCLEPDVLKAVPGALLDRIWRAAVRSSSSSLMLWKLLARSGHFASRHSKTVTAGCTGCNPLDLGAIVPLISSPSLNWVTHLSLETVRLSTSELVKVADLTSLRTLYLQAGSAQEALPLDRIIRGWASSAKDRKSFGVLQMILLDTKDQLSPWTFHYLNAFPALDTFALRTTVDQDALLPQAETYGWYGGKRPKFRHYARKWCQAREDDEHSRRYWSDLVPSFVRKRNDLNTVVGDVPRLKVRCGAPDDRNFNWKELVCFERDWEWVSPEPELKAEDDKRRAGDEHPTKRRKIKANKQRNLDDLLAGF
ncbi:hypothetical protein PRZ48_011480 [Zasmidium cellare]|uniref:Proteophosphoglycan ppg4 n=1 Tax=Zasmidium cellare TaxID=395010 RepID=A0ABR0E742_ZASCE|nr:hypothetical protein PRZ48_011480 [Zasmidium cellare]